MAFPKILQKLFQNNGAGDKLNKSILPDISYNDLTNKPTIPAAVTVDTGLSATSTNPVQNKVVTAGINGRMPMTPGSIELNPGTSATHGGFIDFHYKGDSSDFTARIIEGLNGKGRLDITASGGLFLNNQRVLTGSSAGLTVVAESYSADSWYRKYSDGWIEQGGRFAATFSRYVSGTKTVSLPIAFSTACYGYASLGDTSVDNSYDEGGDAGNVYYRTAYLSNISNTAVSFKTSGSNNLSVTIDVDLVLFGK